MTIEELDKTMSTPLDPRRGVPSASAMYRLENCLGSWLASKDLPDEESDDAASGTRIHKALETGDYSGLTGEELETADRCCSHAFDVIEAWFPPVDPKPVFAEYRELRLGLTTLGGVVPVTEDSAATFRLTGQADLIIVHEQRGLVLDYKTGRSEVKHAKDNAQLRALAVLVAKRWRLASVRVAIVQPWAGAPTVADYDGESLSRAGLWLHSALDNVSNATPQDLHAGDWCQYCKAKATCPALRQTALEPVERLSMGVQSMDSKDAQAMLFVGAMGCDAATLARHVKGLKLLGWYAAAIEGAAKKRAETDPEFQRFYRLKPGVVREKITDVETVFNRVIALGATRAEFTAACSLTKTELEPIVRKATGTKGAELKAKLATVLEGATESKETAQQLEEVKE